MWRVININSVTDLDKGHASHLTGHGYTWCNSQFVH
jgi:hypothetical protein